MRARDVRVWQDRVNEQNVDIGSDPLRYRWQGIISFTDNMQIALSAAFPEVRKDVPVLFVILLRNQDAIEGFNVNSPDYSAHNHE